MVFIRNSLIAAAFIRSSLCLFVFFSLSFFLSYFRKSNNRFHLRDPRFFAYIWNGNPWRSLPLFLLNETEVSAVNPPSCPPSCPSFHLLHIELVCNRLRHYLCVFMLSPLIQIASHQYLVSPFTLGLVASPEMSAPIELWRRCGMVSLRFFLASVTPRFWFIRVRPDSRRVPAQTSCIEIHAAESESAVTVWISSLSIMMKAVSANVVSLIKLLSCGRGRRGRGGKKWFVTGIHALNMGIYHFEDKSAGGNQVVAISPALAACKK